MPFLKVVNFVVYCTSEILKAQQQCPMQLEAITDF